MRQQLKSKAAVHTKEKTVMLAAFAKVLGRHSAADVGLSDKVTVGQFVQAWQLLDLQVSAALAAAAFNKYGQDINGRMPVMVFVESLAAGAPRQMMLMEGSSVQNGPYQLSLFYSLSAVVDTFTPSQQLGKILYRQCKSAVWPPSNWNPAIADRSSRLPEAQLQLEFVYGMDQHRATSSNLAINCQGHIVSYAAAVCFVYNPATHSQAFFRGHDDDICCLALAPDRRIAASGQLGRDATALVGLSVSSQSTCCLPGSRGIQALCFSSSGSKLATIATDNSHCLSIWDWTRGQRLMEQKTQPGAPPAVYGVEWSRWQPDRLATFGQNHIKLWKLQRQQQPQPSSSTSQAGMSASVDSGVFGKGGTHSVLCAVFLPSGLLLTGAPDGSLCSWTGSRCTQVTAAHAAGPLTRRPDGTSSHGGLSCLVLSEDGKTLISGGADGHVIKWDVSAGSLGPCLQRLPLRTPQRQRELQMDAAVKTITGGPKLPLPPAVRALDIVPGCPGRFIAGTSAGDLWEVDADPQLLLHGQQGGEMLGVATNPHYPHVFAALSAAGHVGIWNAVTHKPIRIFPVGPAGSHATAAAFSPDGKQLTVGLNNGGLKTYEFHPETKQAFSSQVDVVAYSPDGRRLAVGGHDRFIDIYHKRSAAIVGSSSSSSQVAIGDGAACSSGVSGDWLRAVRCVGHSSAVKQLDWSVDGSCLQSVDQAHELLCFNVTTGRQLKGSCRDTQWASYTCNLGFTVMGMWPPDSDGTDINAVDRSPSGDLLLTADDLGKVKLFNYPCVVDDAPGRCYGGHSSHVTCVRWASNQTFAVSVGGNDRALFQWQLVLPHSPEERRQLMMKQQQVKLQPADTDGVLFGLPS
eukprot:gene6916-7132_t